MFDPSKLVDTVVIDLCGYTFDIAKIAMIGPLEWLLTDNHTYVWTFKVYVKHCCAPAIWKGKNHLVTEKEEHAKHAGETYSTLSLKFEQEVIKTLEYMELFSEPEPEK